MPRRARLAIFTVVATGVYLAVLAVFDRIAPPYDPQTGQTITGGSDRPHRSAC